MTFNKEYYQRSVINQKKGGRKVGKICPKCGNEWKGYPNERCPECKKKIV